MAPPLEILIVGCSIAGPTLATFLLLSPLPAPQKPRITIVERASSMRKQGQNIDVRGAGVTIIRKLGLEAAIRASTTGEEGVQLVDADNRAWAGIAADKTGEVQTPTSDIEILRGRMAELCWMRSRDVSDMVQKEGGKGIEYIMGDFLDELRQDDAKVHVRFAKSGQKRSFDLVVGADGLQSRTRNLAWGEDGEPERLRRLNTYGGFFSMPRGRTDSTWRRWYHAPGRKGIMLRPDIQNGRTTVFMTLVNDHDERLARASKGYDRVATQKALLKEYFQGAGWESERVVREMMETDDFYYDEISQVKMDHWSKGRVVLLGDAGYCASPFSGMGTTLALNGAYILAGSLLRYPEDHSRALDEYEQKLRPTVERAQKLVPGMPRLLHPETAWGIWMLNFIVFLLDKSGIFGVLGRFALPPANAVPVEDYGFKQLPEKTDY